MTSWPEAVEELGPPYHYEGPRYGLLAFELAEPPMDQPMGSVGGGVEPGPEPQQDITFMSVVERVLWTILVLVGLSVGVMAGLAFGDNGFWVRRAPAVASVLAVLALCLTVWRLPREPTSVTKISR